MDKTGQSHHHHHHSHHHSGKESKSYSKKISSGCLLVFATISIGFILFASFMPDTLSEMENSVAGMLGHHTKKADRYAKMDYDGIDVSHHQGTIDWGKVAGDTCVKFVYIKATEGSTYVDSLYEVNINGARKAGLKVGSYHFLTSSSTVTAQFDNFKKNVKIREQDLIPIIDIEQEGITGWNKEQLQDSIVHFIALLKNYYGKEPMLYCLSQFYRDNLSPRFNRYRLFIAKYGLISDMDVGVNSHTIWQHSNQGIVDGIPVDVDLDMFEPGISIKDISLK